VYQGITCPVDPVIEEGAILLSIAWKGWATNAQGRISWRIGDRSLSIPISLSDLEEMGSSGIVLRRGSVAFHRSRFIGTDRHKILWAIQEIARNAQECLQIGVEEFNVVWKF